MCDLGGIAGSLCAPGCIQDGDKGGAGGPKSFKVVDLQSENKARAHGAVMGGGGISANGRRFSKNITGTLQFDRAVLPKVWLRSLNNAPSGTIWPTKPRPNRWPILVNANGTCSLRATTSATAANVSSVVIPGNLLHNDGAQTHLTCHAAANGPLCTINMTSFQTTLGCERPRKW